MPESPSPLSLALVQASFVAGNIDANVARIELLYRMAAIANADLVIFSEMAITGYPPEDLILHPSFQQAAQQAAEQCALLTLGGPALLVGTISNENGRLYNTVLLMQDGEIVHRQHKVHLPNYGVFDERRYFEAGPMPAPVAWRGMKLGLLICEDMWCADVAAGLRRQGADVLIAINASPYDTDKPRARAQAASARVAETGLPLLYINQIGGQDELVFDGGSFVLGRDGQPTVRMKVFREDLEICRIEQRDGSWQPLPGALEAERGELEMVYLAMMLGLRDFVLKNGFEGVLVGMSGGIDSALAAAVAVDALGSDKVRTLMMPSPITSAESVEDALDCAGRLGVRIDQIPIAAGMQAFECMLDAAFDGQVSPLAVGENQTRVRAGLLLALARRDKLLLLNTGNKSEMAVGFTTAYGDLCGHFGVLADVYKTMVFRLAAWRNTQGEVIPPRVLTKPPTAELYAGQTDQDTLPPYAQLDAILFGLVEQRLGIDEVAELGHPRQLVEHVSGLLNGAEYKRHQAPPGLKLTPMAFRQDRRVPLTNGWHAMAAKRQWQRDTQS